MSTKVIEEINALILYQGKAATEFRSYAYEYIGGFGYGDEELKVIPNKFQGDGIAFENSTYDGFVKICSNCDIAIAIISYDDRFASEAGNLWFEIGYWCGTKGPNNLLVLVQDDDDVKVPSDVEGKSAPRFKTKKEMEGSIERFLTERIGVIIKKRNLDKKTSNDCVTIVADTVAKGCEISGVVSLCECQNNHYCERTKLEMLCFSGELLRIGECYGSQYLVQVSLIKIRDSINRLTDFYFQQEKIAEVVPRSSDEFEIKKRKIIQEINLFIEVLDFIFRDYNYQEDPLDDNLDRFLKFCEYRILVSYKYWMETKDSRMASITWPALTPDLIKFIEWIRDFNSESYKYLNFIGNDLIKNRDSLSIEEQELFTKMRDSSKTANKMAYILGLLCTKDVRDYIESIHNNYKSNINDTLSHIQSYRKLINNRGQCFWRRTEDQIKIDEPALKVINSALR